MEVYQTPQKSVKVISWQTRSADDFGQLPLLIINITPLRARQNEKFSSDPPPLRLENNEFLARPKMNFSESKKRSIPAYSSYSSIFYSFKGKTTQQYSMKFQPTSNRIQGSLQPPDG
jgi:hypothetical protein